jgi:hypothetical protein
MILSGCYLDGLIYLLLHHRMLQKSFSDSYYLKAILTCLCRLTCAFPDAVELPPFRTYRDLASSDQVWNSGVCVAIVQRAEWRKFVVYKRLQSPLKGTPRGSSC